MFTARNVMATTFCTLRADMTIMEAIKLFQRASREEQRRIFGMIVTDEAGRLLGMLSMYDILLFVRPKHVQVWGTMTDIDVPGLMEVVSERAKSVRVEELMTTHVVTVTPDTHVMVILDIMIKKHIRRIPVVSDERIEGMVYLSDLFYFLVDRLSA
ncbi:MAG: CBS domain-containing protein [Deltaproteobacteria bacterium]|nr:CBS domain-containing protein [Deltaproteobacteria bacterium]